MYVDRLLTSQKWRMMEDFERGWYWSLILESVYSSRPGYLKLDSDLWRLAGARSAQFFKAKNAAVLACFKSCQIEGQEWIFSARLVKTLEEQSLKYRKRFPHKPDIPQERDCALLSVSDVEVDLELPPAVKKRNEKERLANVAEAKRRGLLK